LQQLPYLRYLERGVIASRQLLLAKHQLPNRRTDQDSSQLSQAKVVIIDGRSKQRTYTRAQRKRPWLTILFTTSTAGSHLTVLAKQDPRLLARPATQLLLHRTQI
jgi:hypothetical protein